MDYDTILDNMSIRELLETININHVDEMPYTKLIELLTIKLNSADTQQKHLIYSKIIKRLQKEVGKEHMNNLILNDDGNIKNTTYGKDTTTIKDNFTNPDVTYTTNVKSGTLNPLARRELHYLVHINTKYREKRQNVKFGGANESNLPTTNKTLTSKRIQQSKSNNIVINNIVITHNDTMTYITLQLDADIAEYEALYRQSHSLEFNNFFTITKNINTDDDVFDKIEGISINNKTVKINSSKSITISFTTPDINGDDEYKYWNGVHTNYVSKGVSINNIPISYINDYGNMNGRPITNEDINDEIQDHSLDISESSTPEDIKDAITTKLNTGSILSDDYRRKNKLPLVRLYGKREIFKDPQSGKTKTYMVYGNYTEKSRSLIVTPPSELEFQNNTDNVNCNHIIYMEPNNDFTINLSRNFSIIRMSVDTFAFLNTVYTFSSKKSTSVCLSVNNFFYIKCNDNGYLKKITIPDGTYNAVELFSYLREYFKSDLSPHCLKHLYVGYSTITGKFFFWTSNENKKKYTIYFGRTDETQDLNCDLEQNAGWYMGFKRATYHLQSFTKDQPNLEEFIMLQNSLPTYEGNSDYGNFDNIKYKIEAESIYNPHHQKVLFLVVDDFNNNTNNVHISAYNGECIHDNILAKINIFPSDSTNFSRELMWASIEYYSREYYGPVDVKRLRIKLVDELGNTVNVNENDYSLTLKFDSLYNI
jgi:hypothetical protein